MNTFVTTALIVGATAALVLGVQRQRLSTLEDQADDLRSEIARLKRPTGLKRAPNALAEPGGKSEASSTPRGANSSPRSQVDLEAIHGEIEALIAANDLANPPARKMVEMFGSLLEAVAECTAEDLEQLVERLGGLEGQGQSDGMISMILQMLAIEQDPLRYLADGSEGGVMAAPELQGAVLPAYARQDPEGAMRWIFTEGLS